MHIRDRIVEWKVELEYATAAELREKALRAPESDEKVLAEAEARFEKAEADRKAFLEKALEDASKAKEPPKELADLFDFNEYFEAATNRREVAGAMRELNQELNLATHLDSRGRVTFPVGLLMAQRDDFERQFGSRRQTELELAADANTLVTNLTNAQPLNRGPITPLAYARNVSDYIAPDMPLVAPGKQSYPYLSSGASVAFVGEGQGLDAAAAAFSKVDILPTRCTGAFVFSDDAVLDVGREVQSVLENDLMAALADLVDQQLMTGTGASNQLKGICTELNTATLWSGDGAGQDGVEFTWSKYRQGVNALFDDKYFFEPAAFPGMHKLIIGDETLKHATGVMNSTDQPMMDALDVIRSKGVQVRPSGRIPNATAKTNNKGRFEVGIYFNSQYARNVVMPQWQAADLLVDPYSQGRKGLTEISIRRYLGLGYRRSASNTIEGFRKVEFILENES